MLPGHVASEHSNAPQAHRYHPTHIPLDLSLKVISFYHVAMLECVRGHHFQMTFGVGRARPLLTRCAILAHSSFWERKAFEGQKD